MPDSTKRTNWKRWVTGWLIVSAILGLAEVIFSLPIPWLRDASDAVSGIGVTIAWYIHGFLFVAVTLGWPLLLARIIDTSFTVKLKVLLWIAALAGTALALCILSFAGILLHTAPYP